MKSTRPITRMMTAAALAAIAVVPARAAQPPTANRSGTPRALSSLRARFTPAKSNAQFPTGGGPVNRIVVKFHEGTHIRFRSGKLRALLNAASTDEGALLSRSGLERNTIQGEVEQVNGLLRNSANVSLERLFTRPESELAVEKQQGETNSGEQLADLNLYYTLWVENSDPQAVADLIARLNALSCVEIAYAQPIPSTPSMTAASTTADLSGGQGYLLPASVPGRTQNGIDAVYAWSFPGGLGEDVRVIDVERGWRLGHEDLPDLFYGSGVNSSDANDLEHGTAVLGQITGVDNGYGIIGIAPMAWAGVASALVDTFPTPTYNLPYALNDAARNLVAGDIMVIEQQYGGPRTDTNHPETQVGMLPVEYYPAEFDAIRGATARGIIVVEAAGNGRQNLDDPIYGRRFDRSVRDSGAIIVGAGSSQQRTPLSFTNFGRRLDVQGWGENITTCGYGDLVAGRDVNGRYTRTFGGTSGATPIVAGASACIQGILRAQGRSVLSPGTMRALLANTGTPQPGGTSAAAYIGPLPNLRAALDALGIRR